MKLVKRKSAFNEAMYYLLNVALVAVLFVMSQTIQSPTLAIMIVLLSKWRIFLVRPRYWWVNIQANLVDIVVGISIVTLMYLPEVHLFSQILLAIQYIVWLLVIKPMSKRWQMMLQSFVAVIYGITALYAVSYEWPVFLVVLLMFVIGYSAARHYLYTYEESQVIFFSSIWGLLFAELGWLAYYWTFSYSLPGTEVIKLPQVAIIAMLFSFLGERIYRSWSKDKRIVPGDMILPVVFSGLLIAVILIFFNKVVI